MGAHRLMGVVNVTPDSFSDGGLFLDERAAVDHGVALVAEGAHILDVGGESTRPGAEPVSVEEELRRVVPVVRGLVAASHSMSAPPQISIDTSKAAVAQAAVAAGATLINDVSAFRADPDMASVVADSDVDCCLMHMLGSPRTMQQDPRYSDVVDDVRAFLEERLSFAGGAGIAESRILLDPGIGFGKTVEHNLALLRRLEEIVALGRPVVIGTSRKSFLGVVLGAKQAAPRVRVGQADSEHPPPAVERLPGTIATNVLALERGASVFRVHDVAPVAAALAVAAATLSPQWKPTPTTS
jgi:dihydropteroate synthase